MDEKKTKYRPLNITIGLHIEQREDGGICIHSSLPGLYLSGSNPSAIFRDLGPVMQQLLIDNEGEDWLVGGVGIEPTTSTV